MNLMRFRNEIVVLIAFLVMVAGYFFNYHHQVSSQEEGLKTQKAIDEILYAKRLKATWYPKHIKKRLEKLHGSLEASKLEWRGSSKQVKIRYSAVSFEQTNAFLEKVASMPIKIETLSLHKGKQDYTIEAVLTW